MNALLTFLEGLASFLSPCTLPMVLQNGQRQLTERPADLRDQCYGNVAFGIVHDVRV